MDNFVKFFTEEGTPRLLANSIWIATASTALTLGFGIFGAYALSRYRFFARRTLMFGILLIRVVPPTATIVPLYMIMINLGLNDTYTGLILVEAAYQLPLALWLLKGFIDSIPMELEEAAWIDGCSRLRGAWRVVFPLARPGIGACALFSFINVWGDSSPRWYYSSRRKSTPSPLACSARSRAGIRWIGACSQPLPSFTWCRQCCSTFSSGAISPGHGVGGVERLGRRKTRTRPDIRRDVREPTRLPPQTGGFRESGTPHDGRKLARPTVAPGSGRSPAPSSTECGTGRPAAD